MPQSYSMDLRERVLAHVKSGHSRRETARYFSVSHSFVINLVANTARRGTAQPRRRGGRQWSKLEDYRTFLLEAVDRQPDVTLDELVRHLKDQFDLSVHRANVSRFLRREGYTYKKNASGIGERTRAR